MPASALLKDGALRVFDYRCSAGPHERPYPEQHGSFSISYVRRGSFGYRTRGSAYELLPGSFLVGRPGDEFVCTHEHHAQGDECLSYHFDEPLLGSLGLSARHWRSTALPVLPQLALLGEQAQAAADGRSDIGLDEAGTLLAASVLNTIAQPDAQNARLSTRDRRRAVRVALWLEAHSSEPIHLQRVACESGVSAFHFLRLFTRVTGVTPHQYLVRSRLRHAARLLAQDSRPISAIAYEVGFGDLSNFIRTFGRAAGVSPRAFRRASQQERKILQVRLRAPALA